MGYFYNENGYDGAPSSNGSKLQHNASQLQPLCGERLEIFLFFEKHNHFLYFFNVSATPESHRMLQPSCESMQRRFLPRRVKSEHTAVHIYFTARRAKHTGAGGHAEPSLCSLKPRASEESRSIVSRFLCLGREEGLVSCEGRLESTCEISGAAASTPSLG